MSLISLTANHRLLKTWEAKDGPRPPDKIRVALNLICLFGQRYAHAIQEKLDSTNKRIFRKIHSAFCEIQQKLEIGENRYIKTYNPQVSNVLSEFPPTQNRIRVFELLKKCSYAMFPFVQKVKFQYKNPEQETISAIEETRCTSFELLLNTLERGLEEKKGGEITDSGKKAMIQFYFKTGALVFENRIIYWNEMVRMWGNLNKETRIKFENFRNLWKFIELIDDGGYSPVEAFIEKYKGMDSSFEEFLYECSIYSIEENLGLQFLGQAKNFVKQHLQSEKIRSDLCYLSADQEFDTRPISEGAPSYFLVRSLQIFRFLVRKLDVPEAAKASLLEVIFFRKPYRDEEEDVLVQVSQEDKKWVSNEVKMSFTDVIDVQIDSPRSERKSQWDDPSLEDDDRGTEIAPFQRAWEGLGRIMGVLSKGERTFCQPHCWSMLLLLLKNPQRDICVETILKLSGIKNFHIDLSACIRFFSININFSRSNSKLFILKYGEVIQHLIEEGLNVKNPEALFFSPPMKFDIQQFMHIVTRIGWFVKKIPVHYSSNDRAYYSMLLRYISNSVSKILIELTEDGPHIGVDSQELVQSVLFGKYRPFEQGKEPDLLKRLSRQVFVKAIQEKYQFLPNQIFAIYVEFLRIDNARKIEQIEKLVTRFTEVFPYVTKNVIYFLYLSCACNSEQLEQFIGYREEWVGRVRMQNKFVLSLESCKEAIAEIDLFVESLVQDHLGGEFEKDRQGLKEFLLQTFFTAGQVLSDIFRITDLTSDGGIQWQEPFLGTHEGKMYLLAGCKIGVYLHWLIEKGCPTLVMSYFDVFDRRALTLCHSIPVSPDELEPEEKRRAFYGLLSGLAKIVLAEEARHEPENGEEVPETWAKAFDGVEEVIKEYPTIGANTLAKIWDFLRRVKLSYRNLHFDILGAPNDQYENENGQGCMFPFQNTLALLPEKRLNQQQEQRNYLPDADTKDVEIIRKLFRKRTAKPTDLRLQLHIEGGPREIFYESLSTGRGVEEEAKGRGDIPPLFRSGDRYIALSVEKIRVPFGYSAKILSDPEHFGRLFNFHNLLLKALVGHTV